MWSILFSEWKEADLRRFLWRLVRDGAERGLGPADTADLVSDAALSGLGREGPSRPEDRAGLLIWERSHKGGEDLAPPAFVHRVHVLLYQAPDVDSLLVHLLELDLMTQGRDLDHALFMAKDAIEVCAHGYEEVGMPPLRFDGAPPGDWRTYAAAPPRQYTASLRLGKHKEHEVLLVARMSPTPAPPAEAAAQQSARSEEEPAQASAAA